MCARCGVVRDECKRAMREGTSGLVEGGMSYCSSEWRAVARGIVWVKIRKGGRRSGVVVDEGFEGDLVDA